MSIRQSDTDETISQLNKKEIMQIIEEEEDIISTDSEEDTDSPCRFCNDKGGVECFACYYDNYDPNPR